MRFLAFGNSAQHLFRQKGRSTAGGTTTERDETMSRYIPQHAAPVRRRRRLTASAGALVAGAALALGPIGVADAKTTPALPNHLQLAANCDPGFPGTYDRNGGTVKVALNAPAGYDGGGVDVRGTVTEKDNKGRERQRTVRYKEDIEPLAAGGHASTFSVPANVVIWRVGVTATPTGDPLADIHALDNEAGPCE